MATASLQDLVARAREVARIPDDARALNWLRTGRSLLANWGGAPAREALAAALPRELRRGRGSCGRSFEAAVVAAAGEGEAAALHVEAARRAGEEDPGKAAIALRPILALLREALAAAGGATAVSAVSAGLPAPLRAAFDAATTEQPWSYRLIPQSYARPARGGHGAH